MNNKKILHPFDLDLSSIALLRSEFLRVEKDMHGTGLPMDVISISSLENFRI